MRVEIRRSGNGGTLVATREEGERRLPHAQRWAGEHALMHRVKKALVAQGHDVVKKRMARDGHLTAEERPYLRTRRQKPNPDSFMVFDDRYMLRSAAGDYNREGKVELDMVFDVFGEKP